MGFLDDIKTKAQGAVKKTKDFGDVTKIKFDISEEQKKMQKLYAILGAKYFELFRENPDENLKTLCQSIADSQAKIEAMEQEIDTIKNTVKCLQCGADCNPEFPFCSVCGTALASAPEAKPEPAPAVVEKKRFCVECGAELRADAVFCTNCGAKNELLGA